MDMRRERHEQRDPETVVHVPKIYKYRDTHVYKNTHLNFAMSTCMCTCTLRYVYGRGDTRSHFNITEDDWWHSNFQKDGQFEFYSMRARFKKPSCLLVVSLSRCTGVIFAQTLVHCSFLTRSRRNTVTHSCTRKRA